MSPSVQAQIKITGDQMTKAILLTALLTVSIFAGENLEVDKYQPTWLKEYYVGLGVSANETSARGHGSDFLGHSRGEFTNMGLEVNAGYKLFEREKVTTFAEVKIGKSYFMEDSEDISTRTVGIFLKPSFELLRAVHIYGLAGVANIEWDGRNQTVDKTGIALGLGGELRTGENIALFAEYVGYPIDAEVEYLNDEVLYQVLTLGVKYAF